MAAARASGCASAGLAPTPEQRARYRAAGLWFVPLLALGMARVAAGSANGRPVGFLVALLVVTVVAARRARRAGARRPPSWAGAPCGGSGPRPGGRPAGASPAELGMATALFGAGVLWAADVETALALRVPREHGAPSAAAAAAAAVAAAGAAAAAAACGGGGCGG